MIVLQIRNKITYVWNMHITINFMYQTVPISIYKYTNGVMYGDSTGRWSFWLLKLNNLYVRTWIPYKDKLVSYYLKKTVLCTYVCRYHHIFSRLKNSKNTLHSRFTVLVLYYTVLILYLRHIIVLFFYLIFLFIFYHVLMFCHDFQWYQKLRYYIWKPFSFYFWLLFLSYIYIFLFIFQLSTEKIENLIILFTKGINFLVNFWSSSAQFSQVFTDRWSFVHA